MTRNIRFQCGTSSLSLFFRLKTLYLSANTENSPKRQWLSGLDSNQDKGLQRALCYRYTTGQSISILARETYDAKKNEGNPSTPSTRVAPFWLEFPKKACYHPVNGTRCDSPEALADRYYLVCCPCDVGLRPNHLKVQSSETIFSNILAHLLRADRIGGNNCPSGFARTSSTNKATAKRLVGHHPQANRE